MNGLGLKGGSILLQLGNVPHTTHKTGGVQLNTTQIAGESDKEEDGGVPGGLGQDGP